MLAVTQQVLERDTELFGHDLESVEHAGRQVTGCRQSLAVGDLAVTDDDHVRVGATHVDANVGTKRSTHGTSLPTRGGGQRQLAVDSLGATEHRTQGSFWLALRPEHLRR